MNETVILRRDLAVRLVVLQVKQAKRLPEPPKREPSAFAKKIAEAAARLARIHGGSTA
jgi:hypothetical protein